MWNIHRQLAGPSGLDCTTTIKVYKASGNSIFGDAEQGLWDRLINPDGFNPKAFKDALGIFLNKYGGDDARPMVLPPNGGWAPGPGSIETSLWLGSTASFVKPIIDEILSKLSSASPIADAT
jgi:hypothetical protein